MKKNITGIIIIFIWILSFLITGYYHQPIKVLEASADYSRFSAERGMRWLEDFATLPHPGGSSNNQVVRDYLVNELTGLGLDVSIQKGFGKAYHDDNTCYGYVENIVAVLKGKNHDEEGNKALLIDVHYDSAWEGPGASDDGVAVASVLETIRALKTGQPTENDVVFLIADREEDGLIGADLFYRENPLAKQVGMVMNFEARGTKGPSLMFETGINNEKVIKAFSKFKTVLNANSIMNYAYSKMPNDTDFTVYKEAGISGINFAFIEGGYNYHTKYDNLEDVNMKSFQQHGEYMLEGVKEFANMDLSTLDGNKDLIYFDYLNFFIMYSSHVAIALAGIILLLFIALILLHRPIKMGEFINKKNLGILLKHILFNIILIGIVYLLTLLIFKILSFLPEGNKLVSHYASNNNFIAILGMGIGIYWMGASLLDKYLKLNKRYFVKTTITILGLIGMALTFLAPLTSYLLIAIILIYLVVNIIIKLFNKKLQNVCYIISQFSFVLILPLSIPMIKMLYEGFGNGFAPVIAVLSTLLIGAFWIDSYFHSMEVFRSFEKYRGKASFVLIIFSVIFMVLTLYLDNIPYANNFAAYKGFTTEKYAEIQTDYKPLAKMMHLEKSYGLYYGEINVLNIEEPSLDIINTSQSTYKLIGDVTKSNNVYGKYHLILYNDDNQITEININDKYNLQPKSYMDIELDLLTIEETPVNIKLKSDSSLKIFAYIDFQDASYFKPFIDMLPNYNGQYSVELLNSKEYEIDN